MNNTLGVSPSKLKGIREAHDVKKKSFDLGGNRTHDLRIRSTVILCRLSYEVEQRKSGTILDGESRRKKVGVHMNVVPPSTKNTNGETEN